jgi:glycosyltransferase involved in cell wall biosynthesis
MTCLTIFIPTFNRLEKLKKCLNCIKNDLGVNKDRVCVVVSNNASTDGTKEYLDSLDWIYVQHNDENLGFAGNVIKAYNLQFKSKFVWIIGDDDYVIPGSIANLVSKTEQDVDFIFCNTMAFNSGEEDLIWKSYPNIPKGEIKGKYETEIFTTFEKLIDPKVADTLMGELMVLCFRQDAIKWSGNLDDTDEFENECKKAQAHNVPLIESFSKDTKVLYIPTQMTFNFWGSAEWLKDYDYMFPMIILWLIRKYRKFVDDKKYGELLNYYFLLMSGSLKRQLSGESKAKAFNESFNLILAEEYAIYRHLYG